MTYTPPERTPSRLPPPPPVADDPGWTSSEKEYRRVLLNRIPSPPAPPAPSRPTRDSSRKSYPSERLTFSEWLLRLIDWLNERVGADKPKQKHTTEQMATLEELFDGIEARPKPPRPLQPPGYTTFTK